MKKPDKLSCFVIWHLTSVNEDFFLHVPKKVIFFEPKCNLANNRANEQMSKCLSNYLRSLISFWWKRRDNFLSYLFFSFVFSFFFSCSKRLSSHCTTAHFIFKVHTLILKTNELADWFRLILGVSGHRWSAVSTCIAWLQYPVFRRERPSVARAFLTYVSGDGTAMLGLAPYVMAVAT